jgi:hypothetical protein
MVVAPAETVNTQLEVDVYECNWCHIVFFTEALPITGDPAVSQPYVPYRAITNSASKGRWSDPNAGSTRIEQMRKCRVQNT